METAIIFICVVGLLVAIVWLFNSSNDDDNDIADYTPYAEYDDDEPDAPIALAEQYGDIIICFL